MNALKLVSLAVCALLLNGCMIGGMPLPHTSRATPEILARVLDSKTHEPVTEAILRVPERTLISTRSGKDGRAVLGRTQNLHTCITWVGDQHESHPEGFDWSWKVEIVHPAYKNRVIQIPVELSVPRRVDLGDVLLEPK